MSQPQLLRMVHAATRRLLSIAKGGIENCDSRPLHVQNSPIETALNEPSFNLKQFPHQKQNL
jgi:hypothetical protein